MNHVALMALLATTGTWLVTALGAATVAFFKQTGTKQMNLMTGFAAGVMLAASFWSLLQPAIERAQQQHSLLPPFLVAALGFLCGGVFLWGSDCIVSRTLNGTTAMRGDKSRFRRMLMLVCSITLHNIPEGLAVGVAFGALSGDAYTAEGLMGAISIAVGIGLQNFPEGAAVSLPLRKEGCSRKKSFLIGQASGMVEPVAGLLGALLVVHVGAALPFFLSFAAGAMVLVSVHELIPESQRDRDGQPYLATAGILLGFTVMMMLDVALG